MKTKRSSISRIALRAAAMLLAAAMALFILADMRLAGKPISRLVSGETDFKGFTTEVHDALVSDTVGKYAFVNLNGLYCKLTGRSVCNQIMRLTNGMLTDLNPEKKDMRPAADAIAELAAFSEGEGAQFLYVLSPAKMDAENALLIPGESDHSNENGDELLSMLRAAGVDTLDLRESLARTPEQIEQYFFRTDHHWTSLGAYYGYAALPMEPDALRWLTSETLEQCRVWNGETDTWGPVYDLEKGAGKDPYELFLSGSVSLLRLENPNAGTDRELIVFRDSFGSSLMPLLAEAYASITLVDIRYLPAARLGTLLDFHGQDVLFLYSVPVLNNSDTLK